MRQKIFEATKASVKDQQSSVIDKIKDEMGGKVKKQIYTSNIILAVFPVQKINDLVDLKEVSHIAYLAPLELLLDSSVPFLFRDKIDSYDHENKQTYEQWKDVNYLFNRLFDVGILDTGIKSDHSFFSGLNINPINATDPIGHGTHVAGIIVSQGQDDKFTGVAKNNVDKVYISGGIDDRGYVMGSIFDFATIKDLETINISLGYKPKNGNVDYDYSIDEMVIDNHVVVYDVFIIVAAGNYELDRPNNHQPWLTPYARTYNTITVGNYNHYKKKIYGTSSQGPTLNRRRKPDICAPGTLIESAGIRENYPIVDNTGTSMAAPHVTGAVMVLSAINGKSHKPMVQKAILINTAETLNDNGEKVKGSYWSKAYGWGLLNLREAINHSFDYIEGRFYPNDVDDVNDVKLLKSQLNNNNKMSNFQLYYGKISPKDKATLVWDLGYISNYEDAAKTLHDLDLYAYSFDEKKSILKPLAGDMKNTTIDNVEQFGFKEGNSQNILLKVEKKNHSDKATDFALTTSGKFHEIVELEFVIDNDYKVDMYITVYGNKNMYENLSVTLYINEEWKNKDAPDSINFSKDVVQVGERYTREFKLNSPTAKKTSKIGKAIIEINFSNNYPESIKNYSYQKDIIISWPFQTVSESPQVRDWP